MKKYEELVKIANLQIKEKAENGFFGLIYLPLGNKNQLFSIVCTWDNGWEHVSIAHHYKDPEWQTMCKLKELFWNDDEIVVQYHPKKSEYINLHPHCLHLWKPIGEEIVHPPKELCL